MNDVNRTDQLSALDRRFGEFIAGFSPAPDPHVALAAALVSHAAGRGDACLELSDVDATSGTAVPDATRWTEALERSSAVGRPGQKRPLILDAGGRLYLYRYWEYEDRLARDLRARAGRRTQLDPQRLDALVRAVFDRMAGGPDEGQRAAAAAAAQRGVTVVTGGPGSGKTYTISAILELLGRLQEGRPLRALLTAPTGKAAARLQESLRRAAPAEDAAAPARVATIHRMLQPVFGTTRFRFDRQHPLPADAVVVDEASMVDLALMAKLVDALPPEARLILVGDRHQLASVEAGSVLGDLCGGDPDGRATPGGRQPIESCIVELERSYRFAPGSAIGELSRAVNAGDARAALDLLAGDRSGTVEWIDPDRDRPAREALRRKIEAGCRVLAAADEAGAALDAVGRFKILCAHASGPTGADALNRECERLLKPARRVDAGGSPWYAGRPVLVTRNDYTLSLFNGDIGVTLADPATGRLWVHFPAPSGERRTVAPQRLPEHETAYALTVHKSQGSEFDEVLLVLPERDSPVLTRELLYTALTRARSRIVVCGRAEVIATTVRRRIRRASGLRDAMWGPPPGDA
jgi:exodeoxyribonuclease V alpha subunit